VDEPLAGDAEVERVSTYRLQWRGHPCLQRLDLSFYLASLDAEQALEIDPNHIKALFRLGRAMRHMGVGDQAEESEDGPIRIIRRSDS
jgi:hypothetical protein